MDRPKVSHGPKVILNVPPLRKSSEEPTLVGSNILQVQRERKNRQVIRLIVGSTVGALAIATGVIFIAAKNKDPKVQLTDSNPAPAIIMPTLTSTAIAAPGIDEIPEPVPTLAAVIPTSINTASPEASTPLATGQPINSTQPIPSAIPQKSWANTKPPATNTKTTPPPLKGGIIREVPF